MIAGGWVRSVRGAEGLRSTTRLDSRSPGQAMGFAIRSGLLNSAATEEVSSLCEIGLAAVDMSTNVIIESCHVNLKLIRLRQAWQQNCYLLRSFASGMPLG